MEAAGVVEGDLGGAEGVGGGEEVGRVEGGAVGDGRVGGGDGFDGGFAAEATGGGTEEVAGEALEVEGDAVGEEDEGVVVAGFGVDGGDLFGAGDDGFGEEEAGGEFAVVAGSAHEDGEGVAIDDELEGFLHRGLVNEGGAVLAGDWKFLGGTHGGSVRGGTGCVKGGRVICRVATGGRLGGWKPPPRVGHATGTHPSPEATEGKLVTPPTRVWLRGRS